MPYNNLFKARFGAPGSALGATLQALPWAPCQSSTLPPVSLYRSYTAIRIKTLKKLFKCFFNGFPRPFKGLEKLLEKA